MVKPMKDLILIIEHSAYSSHRHSYPELSLQVSTGAPQVVGTQIDRSQGFPLPLAVDMILSAWMHIGELFWKSCVD